MKTNKLALGVLGAAAAGYALGVLFAPGKGSETRKKIASKGSDLRDNLKSNLNKAITSATEKLSSAEAEATDMAHDAKKELSVELENLKSINKSVM